MGTKTPTLYDFRFSIYPATFEDGFTTVALGLAKENRYLNCHERLSFKDAQARLQEYSQQEYRSHAAYLAMRYPQDRCPPGFKALKPIYFDAEKADALARAKQVAS